MIRISPILLVVLVLALAPSGALSRRHGGRGTHRPRQPPKPKTCPPKHPYAYYNGHYCCAHNREKHYRPQGSRCDGSVISITSLCCKDDAHVPCKNKPCGNYNSKNIQRRV